MLPGTLHIHAGGVVLRGEGNETKLVAAGKGQRALIDVRKDASTAVGHVAVGVDDVITVLAHDLPFEEARRAVARDEELHTVWPGSESVWLVGRDHRAIERTHRLAVEQALTFDDHEDLRVVV